VTPERTADSLKPAAPAAGATLASTEEERRVFNKIAWRLMPVLIASYILNYLDRTNISFAGLRMNQDVGLSATAFGIGAGIFFAGYCLFEVPSNMILYRVGARRWIARIMVSWGLVSAATIFAVGPYSFYLLRFLLGVAEAGFFPGIAFYLSTWFSSEYRTRIIAWFMVAIPISSVVGGPVSAALLAMDGFLGMAGWQWLFLIEGLPAVALGFVVLRTLTERPEDADWLTDDEKRVVRARLDSERRPKEVKQLGKAIRDPRVLMLGAVQFGFLVGSYGLGNWMPLMLRSGNLSDIGIGFVSSACYLVASIGMVLWAGFVDRGASKVTHLALSCFVSAVGFVGTIAFAQTFWLSVASMALALTGVNGARAIFWTIPPRFLTGLAAAGGLAFINSIGTAGGFVGPFIVGWLADQTGSYNAGLTALAVFLVAAGAIAWSLKRFAPNE
jgi:sugar phosphate permease